MLVTLGSITAQQVNGTKATVEAICHLLDYAARHPDAIIL
jgi:hypothetical protein